MNHVHTDAEDFRKRLTQGLKSDQTFTIHNMRVQTGTEEPYLKVPHFGHIRIPWAAGLSPCSLFELYSRWLRNP